MTASASSLLRVLLLGSGGREAALAWCLHRSPLLGKLHVLPGNPGMSPWAEAVPGLAMGDQEALVSWCERKPIDLVVVGPEQPLVEGLADRLQEAGIAVYGPTAAAARLEGSKAWAKDFMGRHGIPTARHRCFRDPGEAIAWSDSCGFPVVLKADGLAAGKGVVLPADREECHTVIRGMLSGEAFGDAGRSLVIEERLEGPEVSLFALCDGQEAICLPPAQDHKRISEGDRGPNTGGMGAFAPTPRATADILQRVREEILLPTLRGMREEGHPFRGTLFLGLMLTAEGPKVIEYNCRFGDPETQAVLPLLQEDLLEILHAIATGGAVGETRTAACSGSALAVVLASRGYPAGSSKGDVIHGLEGELPARVFHAGTALERGQLVTAGGRVLALSAQAPSLAEARQQAYAAVARIRFEGMQFRRDIAAGASEEDS